MELEPFGALNPLGLSRSVFSTQTAGFHPPITVCFRNKGHSVVDIHWIQETKNPIRYAQLRRGEFVVLRTFPKHPWVFREADTGAPCLFSLLERGPDGFRLSRPQEVYWPQPFPPHIIAHVDVFLMERRPTLVDLCVAQIANTVRTGTTINNLPLPATLLSKVCLYLARKRRYQATVSPLLVVRNTSSNDAEWS